MDGGAGFDRRDRAAAQAFAEAAARAGVGRIVYLGGLGDPRAPLSPHLASRQEVGDRLRSVGVPVIEFRASVVLGAGSLSFEMIRALVERLPVMVCPRWVGVPAQPIAVDDVLAYLESAVEIPASASRVYEIGGADVTSYAGLMREYALQRGLRRILLPVPVLTPRLSSLWLGLVTPFVARVGRILIESIRHPTVVGDPSALRDFPHRPVGVREAMSRAFAEEDLEFAGQGASVLLRSARIRKGLLGRVLGHRRIDSREAPTRLSADRAYDVVRRLGAARWPYADGLRRFRTFIERAVGGAGGPWRADVDEPCRRIRFRAGIRVPGRAWLEYEIRPSGSGALVRQTALFDPRGLGGLLYWAALLPLHRILFDGLLRSIAGRGRGGDLALQGPR